MNKDEFLRHFHEKTDIIRRNVENFCGDARALGCDRLKLDGEVSTDLRLVSEGFKFNLANSISSHTLYAVVHNEQKKGSASINSLDADTLRDTIDKAKTIASYSVADPDLTMAEGSVKAPRLDFTWDERMAGLDLEAIKDYLQIFTDRLRRDPRIAIDRLEMSASLSWNILANSLGIQQEEAQTVLDWSYMGMAREGESVSGFDYDAGFSFQLDGWEKQALQDVDQFVERVVLNLKATTCPTYRGAVLFSPRATEEIFWSIMMYHLSGRTVMDGKSQWQKSIGQKVLPEAITIRDRAYDQKMMGSTTFDSDGLATKPQTLIDKGCVVQHVHDVYNAKKCGARPNGLANGPFAPAFEPGTTSKADLFQSRGEILYVERFAGNIDHMTGHFSGVAKSSRLIVNGQPGRPVNETMIAGNFFELAKHMRLSKEVELVSGDLYAPTILMDGVSVSGSGE